MNFMTLNMRGLSPTNSPNYTSSISNLNSLISAHNPLILILTDSRNHLHFFHNSHQYLHSPSTFGGVSIISRSKNLSFINSTIDPDGRFIYTELDFNGLLLKILAMYLPGKAHNRQNWIFNHFPSNLHPNVIIGDLNISLDYHDSHTRKNHPKGDRDLLKFLFSRDLVDIALYHNAAFPTFFGPNSHARLDRVFLSRELIPYSSNVSTILLPSRFDHKALSFNLSTLYKKKRRDFYYSPTTFRSHERKAMVKDLFNNLSTIDWNQAKYSLRKDLIILQSKLRFEDRKFINDFKRISTAIDTNPPDLIIQRLEIDKLTSLITRNRLYKLGLYLEFNNESPDKKLTNILKPKIKSNSTPLFSNPSSPSQVAVNVPQSIAFAHQFYSNLYSEHKQCHSCFGKFFNQFNVFKKIDVINARALCEPFSQKEIAKTIKLSSMNSAAGPDGLPYEFYKDHIKDCLGYLTKLFNEYLSGSPVSKSQKNGSLILLHKKGNLNDIANYRPITLLNTDYKLLTATLNRRILVFLESITRPEQKGFTPNRSILENPIIIDYIMKLSKTFFIAFIDFQKAFDSVSHKTITSALHLIGFPAKITKLIKSLLKDATITLNMGAMKSDAIQIKKGTRQGDPISPTLFNITINFLSNYLNSNLKGITINNQKISHLLFADDLVLISETEEELKKGLDILTDFGCATGLKLNKDKSSLLSSTQSSLLPTPESLSYLGFEFNRNGLMDISNNDSNKLNGIISMNKSISSSSLRNRCIIFKSYVLSTYWHKQYLQQPSQDFISYAMNLQNWFIFFPYKPFDPNRRYIPKISLPRASKEYWEGGIKQWCLWSRAFAQKAFILEDFLRNTNSIIHKLWYPFIQNSAISLSKSIPPSPTNYALLDNCLFSWWKTRRKIILSKTNFCDLWNEYATVSTHPTIKSLYAQLINELKSKLSKAQLQAQSTHFFSYAHLWRKIYSTHITVKERGTVFKFLTNSLPYSRNSPCPFCHQPETRSHIFFTCARLSAINALLEEICSVLNIKNIKWSENSFYYLISRVKQKSDSQTTHLIIPRIVLTSTLHKIWTSRCHKLYNPLCPIDINTLPSLCYSNLTKSINNAAAKLNIKLEKGYFYANDTKFILTNDQRISLKSKFKIIWDIPRTFRLHGKHYVLNSQ